MDDRQPGWRQTFSVQQQFDWLAGNMKSLLAAIVESSDDAIVSKGLDGIVTSWNAGAERMFGYTAGEMIGRHISILIPEARQGEEQYIIERIGRGERIQHYDTVRRRKSGELIDVSLTISPIRDAGGRIIGVSKIARDITERKRMEETQRLFARELNHRSRNLLAVIEAIIRQTARHSSPEEFGGRISQRLHALSASQDVLIEGNWLGTDLERLARSQFGQIEDFPDKRVTMAGPPVLLTPKASQTLGMAFHELATNALRFGALSRPEGTVRVSWRLTTAAAGRGFLLVWRECGGPAATRPSQPGFGSAILHRITAQSVDGRVSLRYSPDGVVWALSAPAGAVVVGDEARLAWPAPADIGVSGT